MQPQSKYPLNKWRETHRELRGSPVWRDVMRLEAARNASITIYNLCQQWGQWQKGNGVASDLVQLIALYGYQRLLLEGMEEFPIEIPPGDETAWREWSLGTSLREFRENTLAESAGGFFEFAVQNPKGTVDLLSTQLSHKTARLQELLALPTTWYTPEEFTDDERAEMEDSADQERIEEPFALYEQITCFVRGIQALTPQCLENDPDFGLPNTQLYYGLVSVDRNRLLYTLHNSEAKLREIRKFLGGRPHVYINIDHSPDSFWWRHWQAKKPRHDTRKR